MLGKRFGLDEFLSHRLPNASLSDTKRSSRKFVDTRFDYLQIPRILMMPRTYIQKKEETRIDSQVSNTCREMKSNHESKNARRLKFKGKNWLFSF